MDERSFINKNLAQLINGRAERKCFVCKRRLLIDFHMKFIGLLKFEKNDSLLKMATLIMHAQFSSGPLQKTQQKKLFRTKYKLKLYGNFRLKPMLGALVEKQKLNCTIKSYYVRFNE